MSNGLSLRKMMLRESSYKASDTSLIYIAVAKMPSAAIADSASNIIVFRFRLAAQAKIDDVFSASGRGVSDAPVYRAVVELKTEKFGGKRQYDFLAVAVKENWVLTQYAGRCCHDLTSFVAFCWVEASLDRSMFGHRPLPP